MRIKIDLEITSSPQATPKEEAPNWISTIGRYLVFKLLAAGAAHLVLLLIDKLR